MAEAAPGLLLGVDVGGTFTDLVALDGGGLRIAKVPSTPRDQSEGVLSAVAAAHIGPGTVRAFAHGMTVATNALLERRGARTALITTEGFRDILEIARQDRPALYDLALHRPAPLVERELRFTVRERMGPEGVVLALDEDSLAEAVAAVAAADVEAVAVCLLHAYAFPAHEERVEQALRAALPEVHVSRSSAVLPEFREFERFSTTAADAYLAPRLSAYLRRLAGRSREAGIPAPRVMQSSGGVRELAAAAAHASAFVLSGPAGGVVGAGFVAAAAGYRDVLTFDMGGTSTDVAAITGGEVTTTTGAVVAGVPLRHPMVDVHTVSAGGGSIARADDGGALLVGPHSAGASPGPACYDLGGTEATVTDANLVLGLLDDGAQLGGRITLRRTRAEAVLAELGAQLGLSPVDAALGVVAVANAEMVRALRVISVQRGLDPREYALVAFGGAGGLHACALAEELGMRTVLVPRAGGVLSALGLAISDLRHDAVAPLRLPLAELSGERWEQAFAAIEDEARAALGEPELRRRADMRYRGQSFEITVDAGDLSLLAERFHAAHRLQHGYAMEEEPVELVAVRVVATVPGAGRAPGAAELLLGGDGARGPAESAESAPRRRRVACFGPGDEREVEVVDFATLRAGDRLQEPCIVELDGATCVVRPGWRGEMDATGMLVLCRS